MASIIEAEQQVQEGQYTPAVALAAATPCAIAAPRAEKKLRQLPLLSHPSFLSPPVGDFILLVSII
jgi:hypothetical protein